MFERMQIAWERLDEGRHGQIIASLGGTEVLQELGAHEKGAGNVEEPWVCMM
jgi:hypothetical protein